MSFTTPRWLAENWRRDHPDSPDIRPEEASVKLEPLETLHERAAVSEEDGAE